MKLGYKIFLGCLLAAGLLLMIVSLALSTNKKVAQNQYAVVYNNFDMEVKKIIDQGTYTIDLGDQMKYYTSTIQYLNYEGQTTIKCFSKDGLEIDIDVSVQYTYRKDSIIPVMWYIFDNEENYISFFNSSVIDTILTSCAEYDSDEYYSSRQTIENRMFDMLISNIANSSIGIDINLLQLRNIDFPDAFSAVISEKQALVQQIQTQLNNRTSQQILANTTLLQSGQIAQQIIIQAKNTEAVTLAQANATAGIIFNQWQQRGDAYFDIVTSLKLNSSGFIAYLESEVIRLSNSPVIGVADNLH